MERPLFKGQDIGNRQGEIRQLSKKYCINHGRLKIMYTSPLMARVHYRYNYIRI